MSVQGTGDALTLSLGTYAVTEHADCDAPRLEVGALGEFMDDESVRVADASDWTR